MRLLDRSWQRRYCLGRIIEFAAVLSVFAAVYSWRNPPMPTAIGFLRWSASFVLGAAEWLLYWVLFLSIKFNILRWFQTGRLLGFPKPETRRIMRRVAELREHRYGWGWPLYLAIALLFLTLLGITGATLFLAMFLVLTWQQLVERFRRIVPPAVLLLTTSSQDTLTLHARICLTVRRLRAVALLKMEQSPAPLVTRFTRLDCFRTDSDELWEEVVDQFIDISPVVVLDARQLTPAVIHEASRILDHNVAHKLILVADRTGERPLVDRIALSSDVGVLRGVPVVREAGLLTLLRYVTRGRGTLPSPENPLSSVIARAGEWRIIERADWHAL